MKNTIVRSVFTLMLAVICTISSACIVNNANTGESAESYMIVCGDYTCLCDTVFRINSDYAPVNSYVGEYFDETVAQKRVETFWGNEVEVQYEYTVNTFGRLMDHYISADRRYSVYYKKSNDEITSMADYELRAAPREGEWCTEEEMIHIATTFAKSRWAVLQDNNYEVSVRTYETYASIAIYRTINGRRTNQVVVVDLTPQGEICSWVDKMIYSDGIPESIQQAISNLDMDLCQRSIEHYIEECAKEKPDKEIRFEELAPNNWFDLCIDGSVYWSTYVWVSIDGERIAEKFHVMIPYGETDSSESSGII